MYYYFLCNNDKVYINDKKLIEICDFYEQLYWNSFQKLNWTNDGEGLKVLPILCHDWKQQTVLRRSDPFEDQSVDTKQRNIFLVLVYTFETVENA